jgi:hypothetical protein
MEGATPLNFGIGRPTLEYGERDRQQIVGF